QFKLVQEYDAKDNLANLVLFPMICTAGFKEVEQAPPPWWQFWRRTKLPSVAFELPAEAIFLNAIDTHCRQEQLETDRRKNTLVLDKYGFNVNVEIVDLRAAVNSNSPTGKIYAVTAWADLSSDATPWKRISDPVVGIAPSREQAISESALAWLHRVPALIIAIIEGSCQPLADVSDLQGFDVYSSNFQIRGGWSGQSQADSVTGSPPFAQLVPQLKDRLTPNAWHWIRITINHTAVNSAADCFVDNVQWPEGVTLL